jgi:hypothetical protein
VFKILAAWSDASRDPGSQIIYLMRDFLQWHKSAMRIVPDKILSCILPPK